jgi:large subunit ribosomal protein L17
MRHRRKVKKLGVTRSHRRAMLANMVTSLFEHEQVQTTTTKAKALKIWTDRLVSLAKRGDLHSRRMVAATVKNRVVLRKLFDEIAPKLEGNTGGSCRIIHLGHRLGDGAQVSLVRLLTYSEEKKEKKKAKGKKPKKEKPAETKAARGEKQTPEAEAEESPEEERDEEKE